MLFRSLLLVLAGLALLLRRLVLELAVVHDLADRGLGGWCNFDEVEIGIRGDAECIFDAHDADLLAVRPDEPDLRYTDAVVDARLCADGVSSVSGSCVALDVLDQTSTTTSGFPNHSKGPAA